MTNFIYNMQDELFHLPLEDFSTIKKLVDHIEAQGKQLRELNKAITKKNATIEKYEREKKDLQKSNSCLYKKVVELNNGIRNSEDLTWKQKYEALLHSSEQAIGALQKKCQEYKNSESDAITSTIETLVKENKELKEEVNLYIGVTNTKNEEVEALAKAVRCPWGNNAEIVSAKTARIKELEAKVKDLEAANEKLLVQDRVRNGVISLSSELNTKIDNQSKEITRLLKNQETLKAEMVNKEQIISSLDATINHNKKLLDEYMTKYNNLERRRNELITRANELSAENKRLEAEKKIADDRWRESEKELTKEKLAIKKLKRNNDILQGKVNEISDLAESIVMLCDDEE